MKCLSVFSQNIIYSCKTAEQPACAAPSPHQQPVLCAPQVPFPLLTQTPKVAPQGHWFFSCWVANSMRAKTIVPSGILPGTYAVETKNIYL